MIDYQVMVDDNIQVFKDIYPLGLCGCTEEELLRKAKEIKESTKEMDPNEAAWVLIKGISEYKANMKKSKGKKPPKKC